MFSKILEKSRVAGVLLEEGVGSGFPKHRAIFSLICWRAISVCVGVGVSK